MKYSKEIKVGLTLLFSAVIFILGIRFFQDLPLFRGTHSLYSTFEDASGILPGNAVRVNGVRVGSVDEVVLDPETNKVRVHFHVDEEIAVPEGSHTEIGGIAALNSVHLRLHLGPASNPRVAEGGLIPSLREANLLGQLTEQAPGLVEQVDTLLYSANATFASANRLLTGSDEDLRRTLAAFRGTAETLNDLLRAEQARLSRTLANFDQASGDLSLLAAGLRGISDESSDSLKLAIQNLNRTMARLDRTMAGLEATSATLDDILGRIDRGEGTLGRLVNDPGLYTRLDSTLLNLNRILADFQENPARYLKEVKLIDVF